MLQSWYDQWNWSQYYPSYFKSGHGEGACDTANRPDCRLWENNGGIYEWYRRRTTEPKGPDGTKFLVAGEMHRGWMRLQRGCVLSAWSLSSKSSSRQLNHVVSCTTLVITSQPSHLIGVFLFNFNNEMWPYKDGFVYLTSSYYLRRCFPCAHQSIAYPLHRTFEWSAGYFR